MTDQPKVTIDGREFLLDDLSDDAKEQLASMNIVDGKIADRVVSREWWKFSWAVLRAG